MAQPYVGEIRMMGCSFAINGWAFCNGQLLDISTYAVLFNLIGTTYGGDGQNTFALPDLQGRFPIHQGNNYIVGQILGSENVTLTQNQLPSHTHTVFASNVGGSDNPVGNYPAISSVNAYSNSAANATMNNSSVNNYVGGGQQHNNMQPFLAINFQISLYGIFPSQN